MSLLTARIARLVVAFGLAVSLSFGASSNSLAVDPSPSVAPSDVPAPTASDDPGATPPPASTATASPSSAPASSAPASAAPLAPESAAEVGPAAMPGTTSRVVSEFDSASTPWSVAAGSATVATVASPKTSGSGALRLSYDFGSGGQVRLGEVASGASLPGLPRRISVDVYGDASWNVLYLQLQDATGEIFHYRLGNASHTGWATMSVEPGLAAPATTISGDGDGILDLPLRVYRFALDKNTGGTVQSSITLDHLVVEYEDWAGLRPDSPLFIPAIGQATTVRLNLAEAASFAVTITDELGKTKSWSGAAPGGAGEASFRWDGRDNGGALMEGSVRARLTVTRGPSTWRYEVPYFAGLPARPEPTIPASIAGVNSTMMQQNTANRAGAVSQARLMEAAWVRLAREGFDWNRVEPQKGWFEWSVFDQAVEVAAAHNVGIVGVLGYSAAWASSAPAAAPAADRQFYPPTSNADFAAYASAVVTRYKARVHVWEIWNEPNLAGFWKPTPSAAKYTAMLKVAYSAIKAADPTATVLIGGLAAADLAFLGGVHAAGGWSSLDAVAIHTYVAPQPESSMIPTWLANTKAYIAAKGAKPLWITEFGWSTYTGSGAGYIGVSEAAQAEYTARTYLMAAEAGVRGILAYNLVELGTSGTSKLHNYGMVEGGGRQKPAYRALRRVAEALDQATTAGRADPNAARRVTASSLDSTTGWTVSPLGGGSASLSRATNVLHGGAASLRLDYAFTATSSGAELKRNLTLASSPTSVSVWAYGDGSANPVYLKLVDRTGESFQASVGSLLTGWQRMTLYADGADINWTHSGGDNDGAFDYPVTVKSIFVFRGGIGRLSGTAYFDDLQANFGPRVRGTVISRRNGNIQSLYTLGPATTQAVPIPGANAWLLDGATATRLTISGGQSSVSLGRMPVNVLATPGVAPSTIAPGGSAKLLWASGDRTRATLQVIDLATGQVVRNIWGDRWFDAGIRSATWDGRLAGVAAPAGMYRLRLAVHGPDGRVSYLFVTIQVT